MPQSSVRHVHGYLLLLLLLLVDRTAKRAVMTSVNTPCQKPKPKIVFEFNDWERVQFSAT